MNKLFLLLFLVLFFGSVYAQMSDEQVVMFLQSARSQGVSQQEMVMLLTQKGVTQEQLMRIKNNFGKSQAGELEGQMAESRMRTVGGSEVDNAGKQKDKDSRFFKQQLSPENKGVFLDPLGETK